MSESSPPIFKKGNTLCGNVTSRAFSAEIVFPVPVSRTHAYDMTARIDKPRTTPGLAPTIAVTAVKVPTEASSSVEIVTDASLATTEEFEMRTIVVGVMMMGDNVVGEKVVCEVVAVVVVVALVVVVVVVVKLSDLVVDLAFERR